MSDARVTRQGLEGVRSDRHAVTGAAGRGPRRRGGKGERPVVPDAEFRSYYGMPVLNQPVWKWMIPSYFFTGGLAAGASLLGLGAQLQGNDALRRPARYTALGAIVASTGFLVGDLGKPSRFHHMLRVMKLTSPMSVGTWILMAYAPGCGGAAISEATGIFPTLGDFAGAWAGFMAPPVAAYTAALVVDTAVPVWHEDRRHLPFVFVGSAAASAGGVLSALVPTASSGAARRLAIAGSLAEVAVSKASLVHMGEIGEVYHQGKAGQLDRASTGMSLAGAALLAVAGRRRWGAALGGSLVAVGALAKRFAVMEAGKQSAADPKYVVKPQRERLSRTRR